MRKRRLQRKLLSSKSKLRKWDLNKSKYVFHFLSLYQIDIKIPSQLDFTLTSRIVNRLLGKLKRNKNYSRITSSRSFKNRYRRKQSWKISFPDQFQPEILWVAAWTVVSRDSQTPLSLRRRDLCPPKSRLHRSRRLLIQRLYHQKEKYLCPEQAHHSCLRVRTMPTYNVRCLFYMFWCKLVFRDPLRNTLAVIYQWGYMGVSSRPTEQAWNNTVRQFLPYNLFCMSHSAIFRFLPIERSNRFKFILFCM